MLFVFGCEIYTGSEYKGAIPIGYVYILEACGATIGGLLASFLLIRILPSFIIIFILSLLNITVALLLTYKKSKLTAFFSIGILIIIVISFFNINKIRLFTLQKQWKNYKLILSQNSIYENVTVVSRDKAISFFTNGLIAFTYPDTASSERKAHIPLLEHPDPKTVLLIEGGMCGITREILKHPIQRLDYVEIDPLIIKLAKRYLNIKQLSDRRLHIINLDGRRYVKTTRARYDIVIINLPEPHTAQTNRFYTVEFFKELKKILNNKGIVCFSIYSNPNYISEEAKELYISLTKTLRSVFNEVLITPGETNFFLACKSKGILTKNWQVLLRRAQRRLIKTRYVRNYYLYADFSSERFDYTRERLKTEKKIRINSDFRPISYYYDMVFWSSYFSRAGYLTKKLLKTVTEEKTWAFFIILSILLILPVSFKKRLKPSYGILVPIATTGFAEITFQVVTLLSFQILYGYVFYKLSIILTSYMLGLILGGFWITKLMEHKRGTEKTYFLTQITIVLYPLVLPLVFLLFAKITGNVAHFIGSNIIFPLLPIIPGLIGGFQFPLANKLFLTGHETKITSAGITYGLDLIGSCLGAIVVSVFLIPIIGIPNTCFEVSILNFIGLILILLILHPFHKSL